MSTDQHPLGTPSGDTDTSTRVPDLTPSIVDTMLDLDDFLSGDVRLAERSASFATKPDLQAVIEELNGELDGLTDERGRPMVDPEASVSDSGVARVADVNARLQTAQREYAASFRSVRMRQMNSDEWAAFRKKHERAIAANADSSQEAPLPQALLDELIVTCAVRPTFTDEQLAKFRQRVGHAAISVLAGTAWNVCTESGVSVPKSSLSSLVQRQLARGES